MIDSDTKYCAQCKEVKALEDFPFRKIGDPTRYSWCKLCCCRRTREWILKNKEKARASALRWQRTNSDKKRNITLRHRHGPGAPELYAELLQEQGNKCAICFVGYKEVNSRFAMDHCHTSMSIRGLLCGACNRGLGLFKENPDLLTRVINYIKRGTKHEEA